MSGVYGDVSVLVHVGECMYVCTLEVSAISQWCSIWMVMCYWDRDGAIGKVMHDKEGN